MQKEIRVVDEKQGITRVTTWDQRFYVRQAQDKATGNPIIEWRPSVTWICSTGSPTSEELVKWQAKTGWDESRALRDEAGARGSKIHLACAGLLRGEAVQQSSVYWNDVIEREEPLTFSEYAAIESFKRWVELGDFKVCGSEFVAWPEGENFATTIDLELEAERDITTGRGDTKLTIEKGTILPCDIKSGQGLWLTHKLQVSAHRICIKGATAQAILRIGYRGNKEGFLFSLVEDKLPLFRAAQVFHADKCAGEAPLQKDYPLVLKLDRPPLAKEA